MVKVNEIKNYEYIIHRLCNICLISILSDVASTWLIFPWYQKAWQVCRGSISKILGDLHSVGIGIYIWDMSCPPVTITKFWNWIEQEQEKFFFKRIFIRIRVRTNRPLNALINVNRKYLPNNWVLGKFCSNIICT